MIMIICCFSHSNRLPGCLLVAHLKVMRIRRRCMHSGGHGEQFGHERVRADMGGKEDPKRDGDGDPNHRNNHKRWNNHWGSRGQQAPHQHLLSSPQHPSPLLLHPILIPTPMHLHAHNITTAPHFQSLDTTSTNYYQFFIKPNEK